MLSILSILLVLVPILLVVAFITLLERKVLASMQRRVGPDTVGIFGLLQPFSDAAKLLVKEIIIPAEAQSVLFVIAPALTLLGALLGWAIIPFNVGTVLVDLNLGWLYYLAISSLGIYGIIFGGWSANSVYSLLGSLRSTAQMISYELVLGGSAIGALLLATSFDFTVIMEHQRIAFMVPLIPLFLMFLISGLAEINRTPFDLVEAESELVSGFMTEHSGFIFVAYFLAEYSNIALISTLTAIIWLKGSLFITDLSLVLALKSILMIFAVIWVRGTLPRLRFDLLMNVSWKVLLPLIFGLIVFYLSYYLLLN